MLIGYGAGAIYPYLAFETLRDMIARGLLKGVSHERAVDNYVKAIVKGVVKVMSKMGISTIDGYRGAQIFEALGLNSELVDRYFTWTASRIGGVRHGRDRSRDAAAATGRPSPDREQVPDAWTPAASTSGAPTASITSSTRSPCTRFRRPAARATTASSKSIRR